mmetsp:Transcript_46237/g.104414  ORF Transcript_46237/g.104414 Transcript_46237/m.104414 type:complete len:422 (+) Transcript_46237:111-1376(+)
MAFFVDPGPVPEYQKGSYQQPDMPTLDLLKADYSDVTSLKKLLDAGAKPLFFKEGTTALHRACSAGKVEAATLFLEAYQSKEQGGKGEGGAQTALADALGARTDANQETPILSACGAGAEAVVALLLSKGASALDANSYGSTCLHLASRSGPPVGRASNCANLLLERGAQVNVANHRGSTPLHFALHAAPEAERLEALKALLDAGADANAADEEGSTVLMSAVKTSRAVIELLLSRGADTTRKDAKGRTAADFFTVFTPGMGPDDVETLVLLGGEAPAPAPKENETPSKSWEAKAPKVANNPRPVPAGQANKAAPGKPPPLRKAGLEAKEEAKRGSRAAKPPAAAAGKPVGKPAPGSRASSGGLARPGRRPAGGGGAAGRSATGMATGGEAGGAAAKAGGGRAPAPKSPPKSRTPVAAAAK